MSMLKYTKGVCILSFYFVILCFSPLDWNQASAASKINASKRKHNPYNAMARWHFKQGQTHYALGEFNAAIKSFEKAYELSKEPALLFNIAQAYRLNQELSKSLHIYRSYLRTHPNAPNRQDVLIIIHNLEEELSIIKNNKNASEGISKKKDPDTANKDDSSKKTVSTPYLLPPPPPPMHTQSTTSSSWLTLRNLGYTTIGLGVLCGATAGYFAYLSSRDADKISSLAKAKGTWSMRYNKIYQRGERHEKHSIILGLISGVTLFAGGTLVLGDLLFNSPSSSFSNQLVLQVYPSGVVITWQH